MSARAPAEKVLDVTNLSVTYRTDSGPVAAVHGLSFSIGRGEALGLVGESGSGKSTVAAAVLGLLPHGAGRASGRMALEGIVLPAAGAARRRLLGDQIGAVFQDPFTSFNPGLRVGEQVAESLRYKRGLSRALARRRVIDLLEQTGIRNAADAANAYPHQLSGGMRQRALIAAAIACEPPLLILDEPTTALDVTIEAQILDLLATLRRERGMSLLFISHNLAVVRRVCDRVLVLYAGRLMECGSASELFARPRHPYARGLLAAIPDLSARRSRRLAAIPGSLPNAGKAGPGCVFAPRCPFADAACTTRPPAMAALGADHVAACDRLGAIGDRPWPAEPREIRAAPPSSAKIPLVRARGLSRDFALGREWFPPFGKRGRRVPWPIVTRRTLRAVDGVDLDVGEGEVVGLVGESGSGKSTLGRLLLALSAPTEGAVDIGDVRVAGRGARKDGAWRGTAQIVFQNPDSALNPRHTIGRGLARVLVRRQSGNDVPRKVAALLELVGLPASYASRYPFQLSGGEKQRVSIARALATDPRFIVLDEAVSALDVSVQAMILNLLSDLRDRFGLAYLFISHDLAVVAHMADRIAIMYRGAVVESGPAAAVLAPPYHPYTHLLLSSAPQLPPGQARPAADRPSAEAASAGCRFADRCAWRIDGVCDRTPPPERRVEGGHRIACHRDVAELATVGDVWKRPAASGPG